MDNIFGAMASELQGLSSFVQQYIILNKVCQTSQSVMILLEHVRAQLDMLSLRHLSPSIMTHGYLRELLFKIQTELPHHLRLPVDPIKELWRYHKALRCVTLLEDKLLVLMTLALLDRESNFEIYLVINLHTPCNQRRTMTGGGCKISN